MALWTKEMQAAKERCRGTIELQLPERAMGRVKLAIDDMNAEDQRPQRSRDSRVYAYGDAVVETYALLLDLRPPSTPDEVLAAVANAVAGTRIVR